MSGCCEVRAHPSAGTVTEVASTVTEVVGIVTELQHIRTSHLFPFFAFSMLRWVDVAAAIPLEFLLNQGDFKSLGRAVQLYMKRVAAIQASVMHVAPCRRNCIASPAGLPWRCFSNPMPAGNS